MQRISDINDFVQPLIEGDFQEIIKMSNYIISHTEDMSIEKSSRAMLKLSAFLPFIGTAAGHFSALRRIQESRAFIEATGTVGDKESVAEIACSDAREKEEIFNNLFRSTIEMVNVLKKHIEVQLAERDMEAKT